MIGYGISIRNSYIVAGAPGASLTHMQAKNVTAGIMTVVLGVTVAGAAVLGVEIHGRYSDLDHGEAYSLADPQRSLLSVTQQSPAPVDDQALAAALDAAADDPVLGVIHGRVTDVTAGETVWDADSATALTPASATKVLTAAAAIHTLPADHTLTTEAVPAADGDTLVLKAAGDVWLDQDDVDDLAAQIADSGQAYAQVAVDASAWTGESYLDSWDPDNVASGYIAPMEPVMLNGARIGATAGDVPRSPTPARDVAQALADRLGATVTTGVAAPAEATVVASVESPPLRERLEHMVKWSDNVMAEAIGREIAAARGAEASFAGATDATLDALAEQGFDVSGVTLVDNSGLSDRNLIPPALLDDVLVDAATGEELRPLLGTLPVARGVGTLEDRYADLPGRAWVRAKTGTLTGTNALAGTVIGDSGRVYTFALLSNDGGDALAVRRALDEFASVLRTA